MNRISTILCHLLLIYCFTSVTSAQDDTTLKVREILVSRCYYCHGEDGTAEGGLNYILDYERLLTTKQIVPKEPSKSGLYRKILLDDMPKDDEPLSGDEKQLIKDWINAGAPSFNPEKAARVYINPREVYDNLAKDIVAIPEDDRRYMRYFSIVHLYNAGIGDDELETYRRGLSKLVNSLSWGSSIEVPQAVDVSKTIYRIDIRHYEWESESWDRIAEEFPYKIAYDFETYETVVRETQALVPIVNTDWFVTAAAVPPLYHDLLEMPETDLELESLLGINVELNIERGRVVRAGFNRSGVSGNNRMIERHRTLEGPYWKSYDFGEVDGAASRRNIFERPLGPGQNDGFEHDGGELIFPLPNGLQAYMLVDGKGKRINKGPITIVRDDKRPDRQVVNGLSCMSCHARGIITKQDQIHLTVQSNKSAYEKRFGKEGLETILELYPGQDELDKIYKQDRDRFSLAAEETGVRVTDSEPIVTLALRFEEEVDLKRAAAEAGLPTEEFARRIRVTPDVSRSLGLLLVDGGTVTRAAYQTGFPSMSSALRLDLIESLADPIAKVKPAKVVVFEGGPEFVLIPAGKFIMGGEIDKEVFDHPPHEVEITKPFYLATSLLTHQELFALTKLDETDVDSSGRIRLRNSLPLEFRIIAQLGAVIARPDVVDTVLPSVVKIGSSSNTIEAINNLPTVRLAGFRFRLPTEAEWEYAARGGSNTLGWLGKDFSELGAFNERSGRLLKKTKPNPFGLYDIVGVNNVVSDWYDPNYYKVSPKKDPQGPEEGPPASRSLRMSKISQQLQLSGLHRRGGSSKSEDRELVFDTFIRRSVSRGGISGIRLVLEFIEDYEKMPE